MTSHMPNPFPSASLYVGDLPLNCDEAALFEKFSPIGPVLSIRVCRDLTTRKSLGYAYVNYHQASHAEIALQTMNYESMNDKTIRIMWSQRDPSLRRSGEGNIFIKNLDKSINNKSMHDTFCNFGNILSCKVACDQNGSKGYGFVHFELPQAAKLAIEKVNGMLLNGKKVYVSAFISKSVRMARMDKETQSFTNVYIKNFSESFTNDDFTELVKMFGEITSIKLMMHDDGLKSRGFGFVSFKTSDSANMCCEELNGKDINGKKLYVGRAQLKSEREAQLKSRFEKLKYERQSRYQGVNLYVKNLDDSIDDEKLKQAFSPYGTITSAKVMTENNRSKGFGFVCFSTPDEATKAVTEMNGCIYVHKPLYVALAQRKEDRKATLANQYLQRLATPYRVSNNQLGTHMFNAGAGGGYYVPTIPQNTARYLSAPHLIQTRSTPRWSFQTMSMPQMRVQRPVTGLVATGNAPGQTAVQRGNMGMMSANIQNSAMSHHRPANVPGQTNTQVQGELNHRDANNILMSAEDSLAAIGSVGEPQYPNQHQAAVMFTPDMNSIMANNQKQKMLQSLNSQQQLRKFMIESPRQLDESLFDDGIQLTSAMLSTLDEKVYRDVIGNKLHAMVYKRYPEHASKLTGMLLDLDHSELIQLIDDHNLFHRKLTEGVDEIRNKANSYCPK